MGAHERLWPMQAIATQVQAWFPGLVAQSVSEIDSTNSELMRRIRSGVQPPTLLVAERQTAGRGRMGRVWESGPVEAGASGHAGAPAPHDLASLTFSLLLPLAPRDWSGLSLVVGVAIADALHPDLQLKWPNDIWLQGRKLAGILIETTQVSEQRFAVIGVGINILPRDGSRMTTQPACLAELLPELDAPALLQRVVAPLVQAVARFHEGGFAPFRASFQERDGLRGRAVVLSDGTAGTARGVDGSGALLVHTSAGMQVISSAEVSVRPTGGPGSAPPAGP